MFDHEAIDFCQLLIADTLDGFYLEDVNLRILQLLELSLKRKKLVISFLNYALRLLKTNLNYTLNEV